MKVEGENVIWVGLKSEVKNKKPQWFFGEGVSEDKETKSENNSL